MILPPLAVSLGDPAGVGPELLVEAWSKRAAHGLPPFLAVGGAELLAAAAELRGLAVPIIPVCDAAQAAAAFASGLPVLGKLDGPYRPGAPDRDGSVLALASLELGTRLAVDGAVAGLITGPIAKSRLAEVGFDHPGQTEFVAAACDVLPGDAAMMLAGPHLRTIPVTVHIPLADVAQQLTAAMIERKGRIAALALMRDFGIVRPRLAFAALNPHAGEEGRMGDEEVRLIAPAIVRLIAEGIDASGPFAADGLFAPRARGAYDVALCMYHDQALIPLKALDFDAGVNVTLGLPIVRTSPDHGTAFAIAGQRIADAGATVAAIRMAGECAVRRFGE